MSTPFRTAYVNFETDADPRLRVAAKLRIPVIGDCPDGGAPAVVICHGSDGVDGRGEFHAAALNDAGIATLEIDMWAARGTARGASARLGSPIETLPDAFAGLRFLGEQPEINPDRVGIMGFSWGGVVTLLSATRRHSERLRGDGPVFAAHSALYPVCWAYGSIPALALTDLTGAPILIQTGDADSYDAPDSGATLVASLKASGVRNVRGVTYHGAGHAFDRALPAQTIIDPFAHRGRGGPVLMKFHPEAAEAARTESCRFFLEALKAS